MRQNPLSGNNAQRKSKNGQDKFYAVPAVRPLNGIVLIVLGVGISLLLAVISAIGENGFRRVNEYSNQVARIEALNTDLMAENRRLAREIDALRNDPTAAEGVARDELGLVRPGERVFRFEGDD